MTSRKPPSQRDSAYVLQRMARTMQSMVPGTMGGRVANAAPLAPPVPPPPAQDSGGGSGVAEAVFSFYGRLSESVSGPYQVASDAIKQISGISVTLGSVGTTTTTMDVLRNGISVATLTLPGGVLSTSSDATIALTQGDILNARVTRPGNAAADVTTQVRF